MCSALTLFSLAHPLFHSLGLSSLCNPKHGNAIARAKTMHKSLRHTIRHVTWSKNKNKFPSAFTRHPDKRFILELQALETNVRYTNTQIDKYTPSQPANQHFKWKYFSAPALALSFTVCQVNFYVLISNAERMETSTSGKSLTINWIKQRVSMRLCSWICCSSSEKQLAHRKYWAMLCEMCHRSCSFSNYYWFTMWNYHKCDD